MKDLKSLIKSKSLCDISEGLRKEELRTTSSFNSLANLADDERVLSAAAFREFKVLKVTKVSHNTKLIRFEIPHGKSLGLSIGRHITVRARIGESEGEGKSSKVMRAYTPTSRPDQKGYFDLLVKSYEFGKLSPHLHTLRAGSSVEVRGPVGRFRYTPNRFPHPLSMGLIAGGTGLTPCLQVIRCVLEGQTEDSTCFTLLFQNRTEDDILLKEELDGLVERHPQRLRVIYFLSNPTSTDFGNKAQMKRNAQDGYGAEVRGYINADAVRDILRPERCPFVGLCGPSGFNASMKHLLMSVGHVDESKDGEKVTGQDPTIYIW
eukprot:CAMPEP_0170357206 /NCGR_PEP_ID=MMETSP0117_2-20130122/1582_1 /TAXON_ID=400756 /ORGANISM="Durinskia baltica, Strain CSIRO CS-38" /LENGTH=319 /DNA_ID=CAMNT_0010611355 /DNA_START=218 /DNA_END=1173 /DNA_ORIENTATION=+